MFQKIRTFWSAFWNAFKSAINKTFKNVPKDNTQEYRDTKRINFLSIFVSKLNNLSNIESTYEIESDSVQAEPLIKLCKDIETKRFDITSEMLGEGDFWVFPAHLKSGELFHRFVTQDCVRVLEMDGENLVDVIGIIDEYVDNNNRVYLLNRRHRLENGTLTIETYVTNERNESVFLEEWANDIGAWQLQNANHIGVGRFKSPTSSRGLSPIYGVPLNFGCEEIEKKIFEDLEMIRTEFKRAESKIFADPSIMKKGRNEVGEGEYQIPEGVFPITQRAGTTGNNIDIFSPAIRYNEYQSKLLDDMMQYERQIGVDRGFLTPHNEGSYENSLKVRQENANTISLIDKIHTAIAEGVEMTLEADAVFLNIANDLFSVKFDFFDAFEDTDKQYERIANAVDRGILEKEDELKWLYPSMTAEEMEEKLQRIEENQKVDTDTAIERMLRGE